MEPQFMLWNKFKLTDVVSLKEGIKGISTSDRKNPGLSALIRQRNDPQFQKMQFWDQNEISRNIKGTHNSLDKWIRD